MLKQARDIESTLSEGQGQPGTCAQDVRGKKVLIPTPGAIPFSRPLLLFGAMTENIAACELLSGVFMTTSIGCCWWGGWGQRWRLHVARLSTTSSGMTTHTLAKRNNLFVPRGFEINGPQKQTT